MNLNNMSLSRLNYNGFWSGLLNNVLREEQFPAIVVLFTKAAYLIKLLHILEITLKTSYTKGG